MPSKIPQDLQLMISCKAIQIIQYSVDSQAIQAS